MSGVILLVPWYWYIWGTLIYHYQFTVRFCVSRVMCYDPESLVRFLCKVQLPPALRQNTSSRDLVCYFWYCNSTKYHLSTRPLGSGGGVSTQANNTRMCIISFSTGMYSSGTLEGGRARKDNALGRWVRHRMDLPKLVCTLWHIIYSLGSN